MMEQSIGDKTNGDDRSRDRVSGEKAEKMTIKEVLTQLVVMEQ